MGCLVMIALLHNWAMASLLAPPTLSSPAGQQGQFSVAVQFARPTPPPASAPVRPAPIKPVTPSKPESVTKAVNKAAKPIKPKKVASKPVEVAKPVAKTTTPPAKQATQDQLDEASPSSEPQQTARASSQAANGAHQQVVVTEPLFAAPPTPPRYPTIARKRGQQGTVWLDVWLDEEGKQAKLAIAKSSGLAVLDESALKAVSQWQFQGYRVGGVRMASRVRIPVEFALN